MTTTPALDTPAFTLEPGAITRSSSGSRTVLRFAAPARRHFDGAFELDVQAVLFDAEGRFVHRRSSDRSRNVLAGRATWTHELDNDAFGNATRLVYEIQHRFDYRRRIAAGELVELPPAADGSDYYRWTNLDLRTLEDRAVKLDVALWARSSSVDVTLAQTPKVATESLRTEWELELCDAQREVVAMRTGSIGQSFGGTAYEDSGVSMDRRTMRTLRFFELRGRTELRAVARLAVELA